MNSGKTANILLAVGVVSILIGLLTPSMTLISAFRSLETTPAELVNKLMLGTLLFRIGLVLLGALFVFLPRLPVWTANAEASDHPSPSYNKPGVAILSVILLVALVLRLYGLNEGLWHDEITTYTDYVKAMPLGEIVTTYISENQHFLFSILARVSTQTFGEYNWALRLPAALFGVASVWALYLVGREVTSTKEALFSAALMAFSYHHIWFSQNARGYTGLLFLTLLSSWFLLRALRQNQAFLWVLYAVSTALGVYTHTTMLFAVAAQFFIYGLALITRRQQRWSNRWLGFFFGFVLAGFFTVLLHSLALPQVFGRIVEESTVPAWKSPLWTLLEIFRGLQIGFAGSAVAIGGVVVFGAGAWSYMRSRPEVLYLLFIPSGLITVVMVALGHHLWPRFFFFLMGFGVLVAIRGTIVFVQEAAKLIKLSTEKRMWLANATCATLILLSAMSIPFVYGPKQDFQGAQVFVEQNLQPGDAVAVVGLAEFTYQRFYKTGWPAVESVHALDSIRTQSERTWLLYTFPTHVESVYPEIMRSIDQDFSTIEEFGGTVNNGTIYVARSDVPPMSTTTSAEFTLESQ